jgi:hypothetical protein
MRSTLRLDIGLSFLLRCASPLVTDRERLKAAAEQLLTSEGWRRWVQVRSRAGLARLSLNNQLLVAIACPQATFVAGFKTWLKLGYCPMKGSKAIRIMAPMLDLLPFVGRLDAPAALTALHPPPRPAILFAVGGEACHKPASAASLSPAALVGKFSTGSTSPLAYE